MVDWSNYKKFNKFWRSKLGGLKRSLHHSCLQICNNSQFFCFNQQFGPYFNDHSWYIELLFLQWWNLTLNDKGLGISWTHVKNNSITCIYYFYNLCKCLQIFHSVYIGGEHEAHVVKSIVKIKYINLKNI